MGSFHPNCPAIIHSYLRKKCYQHRHRSRLTQRKRMEGEGEERRSNLMTRAYEFQFFFLTLKLFRFASVSSATCFFNGSNVLRTAGHYLYDGAINLQGHVSRFAARTHMRARHATIFYGYALPALLRKLSLQVQSLHPVPLPEFKRFDILGHTLRMRLLYYKFLYII